MVALIITLILTHTMNIIIHERHAATAKLATQYRTKSGEVMPDVARGQRRALASRKHKAFIVQMVKMVIAAIHHKSEVVMTINNKSSLQL